MAELKTKETKESVAAFIDKITDPVRRKECTQIITLMKKHTKAQPKMWGESIVGFGNLKLKYASGRELEWLVIGFSPRKAALTLYVLTGTETPEMMKKLGKHKTGKGCLYIKSLEDIDMKVLDKLIANAVKVIKGREGKAMKG